MTYNSDRIVGELVIRLRIVSGVRHDIVDSCPPNRFADKRSEFIHVRLWTVSVDSASIMRSRLENLTVPLL